jgi:hypothetical protein
MLKFVNTTELQEIYYTYSSKFDLNLSDVVHTNAITVQRLESWNQFLELNQTDLLFGESEYAHVVYDVQNLTLDLKSLNSITSEIDIYLFNGSSKLLAQDKKTIVQSGNEVLDPLKLTPTLLENVIFEYSSQIKLTLKKSEIVSVLKLSNNLFEMLDILDFLVLSDNTGPALDSLKKDSITPIFMLSLRDGNIKEDITKWLVYLNNDESQLIISMLFTKLVNHRSAFSKSLSRQLISIDNMIKSQSRLDSVLLLKLFIWKTQQEN